LGALNIAVSNFHIDLKRGIEIEKIALNRFLTWCEENNKHCEILKMHNDDNKYDSIIILDDKILLVDVKADFMFTKTNNVAIEFHSRGKPSGISTTHANLYMIFLEKNINNSKINYLLVIPVEKIKTSIERKEYFKIHKNSGDSGSSTQIYLYKFDDILKLCDYVI